MIYRERYTPIDVAANAVVPFASEATGGFLCKTAGSITITRADGSTVINAQPVSAGIYYPLPFFIGVNGGTFTATLGASGTLAI